MTPQAIAELKCLSEKIARELVFAEADKDLGLLPVNSLLGQIEELLAQPDWPEPLARAARMARCWVDDILGSTGTFSEQSLKRLGEWATWLQAGAARGGGGGSGRRLRDLPHWLDYSQCDFHLQPQRGNRAVCRAAKAIVGRVA